MISRFINKFREQNKKDADLSLKIGAAVLESHISYFNGVRNPIRSYFARELVEATSDFARQMHQDAAYIMYEGTHEGRAISVKMFKRVKFRLYQLEAIANEVAIASRMSNHNNVLKLLGFCFETYDPILVYEFPTMGNLSNYIYGHVDQDVRSLLSWEAKLRIVNEVANAVAYLHQGLSKRIIHRDIKPRNIFLDQNGAAKLFDFQLAVSIPEGETHVDDIVCGTAGYIDPESCFKGRYTEKSDVHSFGILMFEVLMEKRIHDMLIEGNLLPGESQLDDFWEKMQAECIINLIYPGAENIKAQTKEFFKLAHWCVKKNPEDRPDMVQVGKILGWIKTIKHEYQYSVMFSNFMPLNNIEAAVLKAQISCFNEVSNPIRSYSAEELVEATSDFEWVIYQDLNYIMYKGTHEGRLILVKIFQDDNLEASANEVAVASRMSSNYNNVLKLLGCCFETYWFVYEFPTMGNLSNYIYSEDEVVLSPLSWEAKMRIVTGVANAVAYLHQGLPKRIIHRDIRPQNIFLDQNGSAKLFEFQRAVPIPKGETYVRTDMYGTFGYIAPEALSKGRYTEKSDVYSFGILMFEVLMEKRAADVLRMWTTSAFLDQSLEESSLSRELQSDDLWEKIQAEHVDLIYAEEENIRAQSKEFAKLVRWCIKENPKDRPDMIQVEKAIGCIKNIK